MKQQTIKKNIIFILLIGIEGIAFGLIDWDSTLSDLVYLQHNNKWLISIIGANVGIARLLATIICIYVNDSNKPNQIFATCVTLCAMGAFLVGIVYQLNWIVLFAIFYMLEEVVLEVFSGYHYAYVYHSLPTDIATQVHSKRISIFKITFMIGIAIASFLTTKYMDDTMLLVTILSAVIFLSLILWIVRVESCPKIQEKDRTSLREKLNLKNYTKYYRNWLLTSLLGKFALTSLVVLVSLIAIDASLDLATLKTCKTVAWIFSGVGFWLSSYLIKNRMIVKGDILCKMVIAILIVLSFFNPFAIYGILLLNGLLNPFDTMTKFTMIEMDTDTISVAQKELVINLFGYFSGMLSSYILLNINVHLALGITIMVLMINMIAEASLYQTKQKGETWTS